jgi:hypothetical protein
LAEETNKTNKSCLLKINCVEFFPGVYSGSENLSETLDGYDRHLVIFITENKIKGRCTNYSSFT